MSAAQRYAQIYGVTPDEAGDDAIMMDTPDMPAPVAQAARSETKAVPVTSRKGAVTFDVMALTEGTVRATNGPNGLLKFITGHFMVISHAPPHPVLEGKPRIPANLLSLSQEVITVANTDYVEYPEEDPTGIDILGVKSVVIEAPKQGQRSGKRAYQVYDDHRMRIGFGSIVEIETLDAKQMYGAVPQVAVGATGSGYFTLGDMFTMSGVEYTVSEGKNGKTYTKLNASQVTYISSYWDRPSMHDELLTALSFASQRFPRLIALRVKNGFDAQAALEAKRKRGGAPADAAAEVQVKSESHADNQGRYKTVLGAREKREVAGDAFSDEQSKWIWSTGKVVPVPISFVSPSVVRYSKAVGIHTRVWRFPKQTSKQLPDFVPDPTLAHLYRVVARDAASGGGAAPAAAGAAGADAPQRECVYTIGETRYEPQVSMQKILKQTIPEGVQEVVCNLRAYWQSLSAWGIANPEWLTTVFPFLFSKTPGAFLCRVESMQTAESAPVKDTDPLRYFLTARNAKSGIQPGAFIDLPIGIVSAGYPVTLEHAKQLIEMQAKRKGYAKKVGTDMNDPNIVNPWVGFNELAKKKGVPVINVMESLLNLPSYGNQYRLYIVSNWAEKNFDRKPQLKNVCDSFKSIDAAASHFGAIFTKILKDGWPASDDDAVLYGPAHDTATEMPTLDSAEPFSFVLFGIKHEYLKLRGLDAYLGDNAYFDVHREREKRFEDAAKRIEDETKGAKAPAAAAAAADPPVEPVPAPKRSKPTPEAPASQAPPSPKPKPVAASAKPKPAAPAAAKPKPQEPKPAADGEDIGF